MLWTLILLCMLALTHKVIARPEVNKYQHYAELHSVDVFRRYLQIDTSKKENLQNAVDYLIQELSEIGIPYKVYKPAGLPILVATVVGSDPDLPSIMLNSHMDVVEVNPEDWAYPPFGAYMDNNGDIFARGAQDTKDIAIQYLEAIRRLKLDNVTLPRTLHITFMPDEETGGFKGIKPFVKTQEFKALNVGFALDEGLSSNNGDILAVFVDRRPWQMKFTIHGRGGHGFQMTDGSTMENMQKFMNAVMAYRETQKNIFKTKNVTDFAGYNSLNINILNGGTATNVIPTKMNAVIDMRLSPTVDVAEMESLVQSWMDVAGNMTEVVYIRKDLESRATAIDDSNPYWVAMRSTLNNMGINMVPIVCPATSDMVVIRNLGIPAIGFSSKINTIGKIHDKNEYLNVETFIKGIDIYTEIIKALANVSV